MPFSSSVRVAVTGAGCAAALLVGLSFGAHPIGAAVVASPTATASRVADAAFTQPEQVFDGDCLVLFTNAEASDMLATPVTQYSWELSYPGEYAVPNVGAMSCFWGTEIFGTGIDVVVLPEDVGYVQPALTEEEEQDPYYAESYDEYGRWCNWLESGAMACTVDVTANGIRMSGITFSVTAERSAVTASAIAVETRFVQRAESLAHVTPAPIRPAGTWDAPVDCEALGEAAGRDDLFGVDGDYAGFASGGTDVYSPNWVIWQGGVSPYCAIYVPGADAQAWFDFGYIEGGRWLEGMIAERTATEAKFVDGLGTVYLTALYWDNDWFLDDPNVEVDAVAFDGANMIEFTYEAPESYEYAKWVIAELNAQSVK